MISPCCCPQLFLHSVFGYRGIVLFPWHARLYDRDITPPMSDRWPSISRLRQTLVFGLNHVTMECLSSCSKREPPGAHGSKEVKGKTHTYYQVLIDTRDCPHIVSLDLLLSRDDFTNHCLALQDWFCGVFRDWWLVFQSQRSQTEAVTFLANHDDSRALYAIPGMPHILIHPCPSL